MKSMPRIVSLLIPAALAGCGQMMPSTSSSFGDDVRKLSTNVFTIVLTDNQGQARIAVVPRFQGRVMTSTASGADGVSTGTIHHEMIGGANSGAKTLPKFSSVGGEERLTFGPEGGQYSLFFPGGADFTKENYQVPAALDSEPFEILERAADKITMSKKFTLTNYSNKYFQMKMTRTVKLLPEKSAWKELGVAAPGGVSIVAYETANTLANFSKTAWRKDEGLPSISTVHTVAAGAGAVAILPMMLVTKSENAGPGFTADFGNPIPFDRVRELPGAVTLSTGATTEKIGVKPNRTTGVMGVYDPASQMLTIVQFMPFSPGGLYTDAHWKLQKNPYSGDAASASAGNGTVELQTFSPALELAGWDSATHTVRTYHLSGKIEDLDVISKSVLGVSLIGLAK